MGATLSEIKGWTFSLSDRSLADCYSPDSTESEGFAFLTSVRDATVEAIEGGRFDPESDNDDGDIAHEIADDAPSIYTHRKWREFVDLGAHQEEPEALDEWPADLDQAASVALYQIAERLVYGIVREWREGIQEAAEDEESEEDSPVELGPVPAP